MRTASGLVQYFVLFSFLLSWLVSLEQCWSTPSQLVSCEVVLCGMKGCWHNIIVSALIPTTEAVHLSSESYEKEQTRDKTDHSQRTFYWCTHMLFVTITVCSDAEQLPEHTRMRLTCNEKKKQREREREGERERERERVSEWNTQNKYQ